MRTTCIERVYVYRRIHIWCYKMLKSSLHNGHKPAIVRMILFFRAANSTATVRSHTGLSAL